MLNPLRAALPSPLRAALLKGRISEKSNLIGSVSGHPFPKKALEKNTSMIFIKSIGLGNWNLFFQKKQVPWATNNGKSSKSDLHVAHGAPKQVSKQYFKTENFKFEIFCRDISSEKFVFLLPVTNTVVTLRFRAFPAISKTFPIQFTEGLTTGFPFGTTMGNMKPRFGGLPAVCCSRDLFFLKEQVSNT